MTHETTSPRCAITIDGPACAGKGTVAKYLADSLPKFIHLDTGAAYRAVAYALLDSGLAPDDALRDPEACAGTAAACGATIKFRFDTEGRAEQAVYLKGWPVPDGELRTPQVSRMASACSELKKIRTAVKNILREASDGHRIVADGRDTGTALFPDACLKFYLWAPIEVRSERRMAQERAAGREEDLQTILQDIAARDARDSSRFYDPLRIPEGAVWLDTSVAPEPAVKKLALNIAQARIFPGSVPVI